MRAFSLVELSIVLVILGLVTGGILSGQALIRASELRAITTEFQQHKTAINAFIDQYAQLPGDFKTATQFWGARDGADGRGEDCRSVPATGTATCNGNGSDRLEMNLGNHVELNENFLFWQHLANARLIEGQYLGKGDPTVSVATGDSWGARAGVSVPKSKISNAYWAVSRPCTKVLQPTCLNPVGVDYGDVMLYGRGPSMYNSAPLAELRPKELWSIDTKMDDGKAGVGKVAHNPGHGDSTNLPCITTAPTAWPEPALEYDISNSNKACSIMFTGVFD